MRHPIAAFAFVAGIFAGGPALAQSATNGVLAVTVVDSAVQPMTGADLEVITVDSAGSVTSRVAGRSNSSGTATFGSLSSGNYVVYVRKLGYVPAHRGDVTIAGDTVRIMMMLTKATVELDRVKVKGGKGSSLFWKSITADEVNLKYVYSAEDILSRYRSHMFDDMSMKCPLNAEPQMKVFVNGVRRDTPFGGSPLYWILAKDVQEIRYVPCGDKTLPASMHNALYVVLKRERKLSKREEKALREAMMRDTTPVHPARDTTNIAPGDSAEPNDSASGSAAPAT